MELRGGDPALVLLIEKLETIVQVEISCLDKSKLGILKLSLMVDNFLEDSDELILIIIVERTHSWKRTFFNLRH